MHAVQDPCLGTGLLFRIVVGLGLEPLPLLHTTCRSLVQTWFQTRLAPQALDSCSGLFLNRYLEGLRTREQNDHAAPKLLLFPAFSSSLALAQGTLYNAITYQAVAQMPMATPCPTRPSDSMFVDGRAGPRVSRNTVRDHQRPGPVQCRDRHRHPGRLRPLEDYRWYPPTTCSSSYADFTGGTITNCWVRNPSVPCPWPRSACMATTLLDSSWWWTRRQVARRGPGLCPHFGHQCQRYRGGGRGPPARGPWPLRRMAWCARMMMAPAEEHRVP